MSWLPDSGWLRALDLRASTAFVMSLACWAVFSLAEFDLLYLGVLPTWVRAVFAIVALLTLALWLGRVWDLCWARFAGWRRGRAILAQLHKLSTSEDAQLRHQVERNQQTFSISITSPVAAGLRRKGLLELSSNLGDLQGGHPHTIPDVVWRELRRCWPDREQPETRSEDARSRVRRARAGHRT
jgi:hypothetical protein